MQKYGLAGFLCLSSLSAYAAQTITLTPGQAKRFDVATAKGIPTLQHEATKLLGPSLPLKGQVEISLAPAGHAVQMAKVHVFVRSTTALGFHITAFDGTKLIASADLCGGLEIDSWTSVPAQTSRVVISDVAEVRNGCP